MEKKNEHTTFCMISSVGDARVEFSSFWEPRQNCVLAYCELKNVIVQSTALAI